MKRRIFPLMLPVVTAVALWSSGLAAGKLYKWVDDKGETHYGDRIPPEYAQQGHTELNKQGVTINTTEGAKTEEQLAEEQRNAQAKTTEKRHADEQAARDRVLLNTYLSEDDITQIRDRKLAALEGEVTMTSRYSEKLGAHLAELLKEASAFERQNKPVPGKLQRDILEAKAQGATYADFIKTKQAEQEAIRRQAESDLQRFRELKASASPTP